MVNYKLEIPPKYPFRAQLPYRSSLGNTDAFLMHIITTKKLTKDTVKGMCELQTQRLGNRAEKPSPLVT